MSRRTRRLPSAAGLQLEGVLLAGGLRAVLLQLAHPAVGHGVARHSDFVADPLGRLRGTLEFVYVVAAGDEALVRRTVRAVGVAHRPVRSTAEEPVAYDARDPRLQFWVAATIHDTAIRVVETVWGALPDLLADELLARNGRIATALGLPAGEWPVDRAAFDAAYRRSADALGFDGTTLEVVRALFIARAAPFWLRLPMPFLARATVPTLPSMGHRLEPLLPRWAPDLLPLVRRLAPLYLALPPALRRLPARRILSAARRATAPGARSG